METVHLLEGETTWLMMSMVPSITTLTIFEGDHAHAAKVLRDRLQKIVELNSWLVGLLEREGAETVLRYPLDEVEVRRRSDKILRSNDGDDALLLRTEDLQFRDVVRKLGEGDYLVKNGKECLMGRLPIFKVVVIPDADTSKNKFSVVVSLSHVIGDGHTFYKIFNMLSEDSSVERLSVSRKPAVFERGLDAMKGDGGFLSHPSTGLSLLMLGSIAMGKMFGPECAVEVHYINEDFIKRQKAAAQNTSGLCDYISTNDIITSCILSLCKADIGTMDVNFRGKIEGCFDTDAGNLEEKVLYTPKDYISPSLIRQSIKSLQRAAQPTTNLPTSIFDFLFKIKSISSVSNHVRFTKGHIASTLTLGGSTKAILHLPIFNPGRGGGGKGGGGGRFD